MPGKTRIDIPGSLHHIIIRGIERSPIFKGNRDYEHFLTRLGSLLMRTSTICYAWALMRNHAHFLLRSGLYPISSLMRSLLTGYAVYFNRRHNRSGHLFQNRYKSFLCEEEPYLLELVRYIHLNPIRAGVIHDMDGLEQFPWSGHQILTGRKRLEWQDAEWILNLFHQKHSTARRAYSSFVEKGIALGRRPDLVGGGLLRSSGGWTAVQSLKKSKERFASDERILGSSDFVASLLKKANERYTTKKLAVIDIQRLIASACHYFDLAQNQLTSPTKQSRVTRALGVSH
jgi:putative transposase